MKILGKFSILVVTAIMAGVFTACSSSDVASTEAETAADVDTSDSGKSVDEAAEDKAVDEEYEAVEFTLVNDTNRPILEFYVSAPSSETWEENLIPEDSYIGEYSEILVTIDDGQPDCAYDLLAVFGPSPDGSVGSGEVYQTGVEICDGTTYTYSEG